MDDGDRADLPLHVVERRPPQPGVQPPGPQAEKGRDRLQVVLYAVMDLADGGVLRDQEAVTSPQVGHVADQAQCPRDAALVEKGDAAEADDDVVAPLDLLVHREGGDEGALDGGLLHAELVQAQPFAPSSSTSTPSPTRADSSVVTSSPRKGNSPLTIMRAKRSKTCT